MSGDHDISLLEFVYALRGEVEPFYERIQAAGEGNASEVKRLAANVQWKLRDERLWHIKKLLTFRYKHHPRINKWVHEQLGMRPC
jgi:hypothetical protein